MDVQNQSSLEYQADSDLAKRSLPSTPIYLALYFIFMFFTPFAEIHPKAAIVIGAFIVLGTVIRTYYVVCFERLYARNPKAWKIGSTVGTLILSSTWGLFCMYAIYQYALEWNAMLVLLSAIGFAAGGVTTLNSDFRLALIYLTTMVFPMVIATAMLDTQGALPFTLIIIVYFGFLVGVAKRLNAEYWSALRNTKLLDQRAIELESVNKELEAFAYSVSHDLRTPLRAIDGFSHALLDDSADKLDEIEKSYLQRIRNASQKMSKLIDDLLELSLITRKGIKQQEFFLNDCITTVVDRLKQAEPERNVSINIKENTSMKGDKILLDIVFENLIGNAWKYTEYTDKAEIEIGAYRQKIKTIYYVKDNGVGFNIKFAKNLFGVFQRLHRASEFPGTGIGLATVQRIINRHGGRVWAEAIEGEGASFYFTLNPD